MRISEKCLNNKDNKHNNNDFDNPWPLGRPTYWGKNVKNTVCLNAPLHSLPRANIGRRPLSFTRTHDEGKRRKRRISADKRRVEKSERATAAGDAAATTAACSLVLRSQREIFLGGKQAFSPSFFLFLLLLLLLLLPVTILILNLTRLFLPPFSFCSLARLLSPTLSHSLSLSLSFHLVVQRIKVLLCSLQFAASAAMEEGVAAAALASFWEKRRNKNDIVIIHKTSFSKVRQNASSCDHNHRALVVGCHFDRVRNPQPLQKETAARGGRRKARLFCRRLKQTL